MLLNCDLGESYGSWTMGVDAAVMPYIDQANIACGFHAGDPLTMRHTLALAAAARSGDRRPSRLPGYRRLRPPQHGAQPRGDHRQPALPGRRAGRHGAHLGLALAYVKPHGALYHDMMARSEVRAAIIEALASYHRPLALMVQATAQRCCASSRSGSRRRARCCSRPLRIAAMPTTAACCRRSQPGAVHNRERMLAQVAQLLQDSTVTTVSGNIIPLQVDTLCVHGDNPEGVRCIAAIRALLDGG